jgi:hypothetical protein
MQENSRKSYRESFAALVSDVLEVEVEPSDHFVDIGGDSLSAAIVVNTIVELDGVVPQIIWFFEAETIEELADRCFDEIRAASQEAVGNGTRPAAGS